MSELTGKVLEGVFAIKKPSSLSSAQVLRDLQHSFKTSKTFAPLRIQETQNRDSHSSKRRRIDKDNVFKMGHGGTLDPMATGVLIVGIGRGTKHLQNFLDCTKVYRTVILFGKSTDTYDVAGKIVASKEAAHINEQLVEQKIKEKFTGTIQQVPPIYSALKIDGMKAYEYARSGKKLPRELAARPVTISEIKLVEWHNAGAHNFRWPIEQAPEEEKALFRALVEAPKDAQDSQGIEKSEQAGDKKSTEAQTSQEKISAQEDEENSFKTALEIPESPSKRSNKSSVKPNTLSKAETAALHTHDVTELSDAVADAPAVTIEMTVSSGFYVRSLAHDLGLACDSYGTMAELARTRQGDYTIEDTVSDKSIPAIDYVETQQGEVVWGPKITKILENWMEKNPVQNPQTGSTYRDSSHGYHSNRRSSYSTSRKYGGRNNNDDRRKRRNSSSPE